MAREAQLPLSRRNVVLAGLLLGAAGTRALARAATSGSVAGDVSATRIDLSSAGEAVRRLYGSQHTPLWSGRAAEALESRLSRADAHGLDPRPYLSLIETSEGAADRDLNLSRTALAYAKALAAGVVDPASIFDIYTIARDDIDLVAGLKDALDRDRVGPWFDSLPPQDPMYLALSAAYLDFASRPAAPGSVIPPGPPIRTGDSDPRRAMVLAALAGGAGTAAPTPAAGAVWTPEDAALLRRYQRARGLREDGIVGPNTLALLNASPQDKARRLAVNLERLRWLQRTPPATRIDVNTAASTLTYFVGGKAAWTTVVVPGRPGHATPQLQASFRRLVVNPPWHVPASIARREITPKGAAYLQRHHMRRVSGRIVQSPGPWAALGEVKFDMQDRYAIYLHDTPSKSVFSRSQRHLSHGCVRVSGAVSFARRLAAGSGAEARFDSILKSGRTGVVLLDQSIPVRLIYQTALVDDFGEVTFRPDVYGWDVQTAEAMGMAPPSRDGVEPITAAPLGP